MENERGSWGSNLGFLLATIGSAVGLGNIWGFPYKMGKSGGFTFLVVYLILVVLVGFVIMVTELAIGRKTSAGPVGAYRALSHRFHWVGWLALFSPFVVMGFYAVLGGYCMEYMVLNLSNLAFPSTQGMTGTDLFNVMLTHPFGVLVFTALFMAVCFFITRGSISEGVETFSRYGMPALFFMLLIMIVRSLTLPGAMEGLKFMFVPGYAVKAGFISAPPSISSVVTTAGGQMFFSLSLAMGPIMTYGSYLSRKEDLVQNAGIVVVADTIIAVMAGIAVIPAAVANGVRQGIPMDEIALGGPSLLFVTLQDVFHAMGMIGPLFGVVFYLLVLIAALSTAVSLVEVITTYFADTAKQKGRPFRRPRTVLLICLAILAEASLVAMDGLGANGVWVPFKEAAATVAADGTVRYAGWNDCWLDFLDMLSEGLSMPLGALLMCIMTGWEIGPDAVLSEVHRGCRRPIDRFFRIAIRYIAPLGMVLVLSGQISTFFGENASSLGYAAGMVIAGGGLVLALSSPMRRRDLSGSRI